MYLYKVPMSKGAHLLDMPFFERPGVLCPNLGIIQVTHNSTMSVDIVLKKSA